MKKLIPGLLLITTAYAHAGSLSCDISKYETAFSISRYYQSGTPLGSGYYELAHTYTNAGSTFGDTVTWKVYNGGPINIRTKIHAFACYNSGAASPSACFASTGNTLTQFAGSSPEVTIPAGGSVTGSIKFASTDQKMALKLAVPQNAYVMDAVETSRPATLYGEITWDWLTNLQQNKNPTFLNLVPRVVRSMGVDFPSDTSYTKELVTGNNWLMTPSVTGLHSDVAGSKITVKFVPGGADDVRVVTESLGTVSYLSAGDQTVITPGDRIGLAVDENTSAGNKRADLEATWTCP